MDRKNVKTRKHAKTTCIFLGGPIGCYFPGWGALAVIHANNQNAFCSGPMAAAERLDRKGEHAVATAPCEASDGRSDVVSWCKSPNWVNGADWPTKEDINRQKKEKKCMFPAHGKWLEMAQNGARRICSY